MQLKVKQLRVNAKIPSNSYRTGNSYELSASVPVTIPPRGNADVFTGIAVSVPPGHIGMVLPRTGLYAFRNGIVVGTGVIVDNYFGEVRVLLYNHSDDPFHVPVGKDIAQLVLVQISTPDVVLVNSLDTFGQGTKSCGNSGTA